MSLLHSSLVLTAGLYGYRCCPGTSLLLEDDASSPQSEDLPDEMVEKLCGVCEILEATSDLDIEACRAAGRAMYKAAVGTDGRLNPDGLKKMLETTANGKSAGLLSWGTVAMTAALSELVPILFTLLDADGDGIVTEKEFLAGQALILAAAKAKDPTTLSEACWRALDADGDGFLSREEVEAAVRLMVRVRAVRQADRKETFGQIKRVRKGPARIHRERSADSLVEHYMKMYDLDEDGQITKAEFSQQSALQEDFFLLLHSAEFNTMFMRGATSKASS